MAPAVFALMIHIKPMDIMFDGGNAITTGDQLTHQFFHERRFARIRPPYNGNNRNHLFIPSDISKNRGFIKAAAFAGFILSSSRKGIFNCFSALLSIAYKRFFGNQQMTEFINRHEGKKEKPHHKG
jgi:hypothetical protein